MSEEYQDSEHPQTIEENWKDYADQYVDHLPDHEQYRLKHAYAYCAYFLLADLAKVDIEHPYSVVKQLDAWNAQVEAMIASMARDVHAKNHFLPHDQKIKSN